MTLGCMKTGEMSISGIGSGRAGQIEEISNEGRWVVLELDADRVERRAGVLLECLGDSPVHQDSVTQVQSRRHQSCHLGGVLRISRCKVDDPKCSRGSNLRIGVDRQDG